MSKMSGAFAGQISIEGGRSPGHGYLLNAVPLPLPPTSGLTASFRCIYSLFAERAPWSADDEIADIACRQLVSTFMQAIRAGRLYSSRDSGEPPKPASNPEREEVESNLRQYLDARQLPTEFWADTHHQFERDYHIFDIESFCECGFFVDDLGRFVDDPMCSSLVSSPNSPRRLSEGRPEVVGIGAETAFTPQSADGPPAPIPAPADSAAEAINGPWARPPERLNSKEFARVFDGIEGRAYAEWRTYLADPPKGLAHFRIMAPDQCSRIVAWWDPVGIGEALLDAGRATEDALDQVFRSVEELRTLRKKWRGFLRKRRAQEKRNHALRRARTILTFDFRAAGSR